MLLVTSFWQFCLWISRLWFAVSSNSLFHPQIKIHPRRLEYSSNCQIEKVLFRVWNIEWTVGCPWACILRLRLISLYSVPPTLADECRHLKFVNVNKWHYNYLVGVFVPPPILFVFLSHSISPALASHTRPYGCGGLWLGTKAVRSRWMTLCWIVKSKVTVRQCIDTSSDSRFRFRRRGSWKLFKSWKKEKTHKPYKSNLVICAVEIQVSCFWVYFHVVSRVRLLSLVYCWNYIKEKLTIIHLWV